MAFAAVREDVSAACMNPVTCWLQRRHNRIYLRRTLLLGKFPIFLYARLSSRCTSASTSLSSSRLSSTRSSSISLIAAVFCLESICLDSMSSN